MLNPVRKELGRELLWDSAFLLEMLWDSKLFVSVLTLRLMYLPIFRSLLLISDDSTIQVSTTLSKALPLSVTVILGYYFLFLQPTVGDLLIANRILQS